MNLHDHADGDDDEVVAAACAGLRVAVNSFLQKYDKRCHLSDTDRIQIVKRIRGCVGHACHIMQQLHVKTQSLEYGIRVLLNKVWREGALPLLRRERLHNLKQVLPSVMRGYVRLRDGIVLLTNGECRHKGDVTDRPRYRSRFPSREEQSDGYTKMFKSKLGYTGFGFDEFFDESVGVRVRLLKLMCKYAGKKSMDAWNYLLDHGAMPMETALDQHETKTKECRERLKGFEKEMERDLKRLLHDYASGGAVIFRQQDKMERLELSWAIPIAGISYIKWDRPGNKFQIDDSGGVLPCGWREAEWIQSMEVPLTNGDRGSKRAKKAQCRGRKIIDDDDDSSEEETGGGALKVKLKTNSAKAQVPHAESHASLNAIKTSFGVDARDLEAARETLEDELAQSRANPKHEMTVSSMLNAEKDKDNADVLELEEQIHLGREEWQSFQRILDKLMMNPREDQDDLWDAREGLRETSVRLGNDLLDLYRATSNEKPLQEARTLFTQAQQLIREQEKAHLDSMKNTASGRMIRRRLLLLRARAQTNLGISLVELVDADLASPRESRRYIQASLSEFNGAMNTLNTLMNQLGFDGKNDKDSADVLLDHIEAEQHRILTLRWIGTIHWKQNEQEEAVAAFSKAVDPFPMLGLEERKRLVPDLVDPYLELLVQSFFSSATLIDLAASEIERMCRLSSAKFEKNSKNGEEVLSIAKSACKNGIQTSSNIRDFADLDLCPHSFQQLCKMYDIVPTSVIEQRKEDLVSQWKQAKDASSSLKRQHKVSSVTADARRELGDLTQTWNGSRKCFVLDGASFSKRKRKVHQDQSRYEYSAQTQFHDENENNHHRSLPIIQYAKWGDELLSDAFRDNHGNLLALAYPSACPTKPALLL